MQNEESLFAQFNRFEIELPADCVLDCSGSGAKDDAVDYWESRIGPMITVDPELIRSELREYGAWDTRELADDTANRRRIIWIAANDIAEEMFENTKET